MPRIRTFSLALCIRKIIAIGVIMRSVLFFVCLEWIFFFLLFVVLLRCIKKKMKKSANHKKKKKST